MELLPRPKRHIFHIFTTYKQLVNATISPGYYNNMTYICVAKNHRAMHLMLTLTAASWLVYFAKW